MKVKSVKTVKELKEIYSSGEFIPAAQVTEENNTVFMGHLRDYAIYFDGSMGEFSKANDFLFDEIMKKVQPGVPITKSLDISRSEMREFRKSITDLYIGLLPKRKRWVFRLCKPLLKYLEIIL